MTDQTKALLPVTAEEYDSDFVEAWTAQEDAGYIYSESSIAKVYFGWQLARQSHPAAGMLAAINEALAFYDALGLPHAPGEAEILDRLDQARRISHSLPGDVGMREASVLPGQVPQFLSAPDFDDRSEDRVCINGCLYLRADFTVAQHVAANGAAEQRAKQAAENWRIPDHRDPAKATAMVRPKDDCIYGFEQGYLAALTPSPCPGDGMREAVNRILGELLGALMPDVQERIAVGNRTCDEILAALTPSALSGDAVEMLYMRGYLKVPCEVEPEGERREALKAAAMLLAPYSGDPSGTPTRDGLVYLNAAISPSAAKYFADLAALPSHQGAGEP